MSLFDPRLEKLSRHNTGYWLARALNQIAYAHELSRFSSGEHEGLIEAGIRLLLQEDSREGALTRQAVLKLEALLSPLSAVAKRQRLLCVGHAHIDMNWMWRWDETVAVTLDSFRTVLNLMEEVPGFKFSQSQASVYRIVEEHAPELLDLIRRRVTEGRWEVTASTWVEADKNLPSGESQARHLLYTRRYLTDLLGLQPEQFRLDFEPDTFGHSCNVPEILADAGVRYYYHCRGDQGELLYRWVAPSGRSILVYREPLWYLGSIEPSVALYLPDFCHRHSLDTMLRVYGVGDHGGGPTRRDLGRIVDMNAWPIFPRVEFGTFAEFFAEVEAIASHLPLVEGELNFIFSGCYSSQSRIKRFNRVSEAALYEAEAFAALATVQTGSRYAVDAFAGAWKKVLFNQFHDIIPGSGVIDTREYALGLYQQALAVAASQKSLAFRELSQESSSLSDPPTDVPPLSISEGAGVGFGVDEFRLSQVSRSSGLKRLFYVYNPASWERTELAEVVIWDWEGDMKRMAFTGPAGKSAVFQILDPDWRNYWGHKYLRVLVKVTVPAWGNSTVLLDEADAVLEAMSYPPDPRVEQPEQLLLENEFLRAEFDSQSCALRSLTDKATGEELVSPARPASFRYIREDDRLGMTAWTVGRYQIVRDLKEDVRLLKLERGPLRQALTFEIPIGVSRLKVTVTLDAGSPRLVFDLECHWEEVGRRGEGVPQLNFHLPLAFPCRHYRYDVPFGMVDRPPQDMDVPASSLALALPAEVTRQKTVMLSSQDRYAFRGFEDALALTLLRSSYDPDPYPEVGLHRIRFAISPVACQAGNKDLIDLAHTLAHPLSVTSGAGLQPAVQSFLALESGSVVISAIKQPEGPHDEDELIVRLYETDGQETQVSLRFSRPVVQARRVDVHETPLPDVAPPNVNGERVSFSLAAHRVGTVWVKLSARS